MSYQRLKSLEKRLNEEEEGLGTKTVLKLVYYFSNEHFRVPHPNTLRRAIRDEHLMSQLIKGYDQLAKEAGLTPRRIRQIEERERKKRLKRKQA